jgi:uncharacterized membrane protein YfcA
MTSTVGLWPGSAASIAAARAEFRTIPAGLLGLLAGVSLAGGTAGAVLLSVTTPHTFKLVIPWLLAFATGVFAFSRQIARWAGHRHGDRSVRWRVVVAAIQFVVAVYGGYFGAGIGVLMLAGLSFAGLESIHQMNALKVLLATVINGVAVVIFVAASAVAASPADRIYWPAAAGMIVASVAGGFYGMRVARRVGQAQLRAVILCVGVGLTIVYFWKAYGA